MERLQRTNSDFLEKIMLKGMLSDRDFLVLISSVFEKEYFDDPHVGDMFVLCRDHIDEYNRIPQKEILINASDDPDRIRELIDEVESLDFNVSDGYDFLINHSNDYLKEKALKQAIMDSIDDVEIPDRRQLVQKRIEEALIKDIKVDLGLDFFNDLRERLRRIFTASERRIPTYFPMFDDYISGGFPALTFSVITAKIHGGKSNIMANFAARQVLHGHNVVLLTLEMSEDAFAQRFDSIFTCLDMNRMYLSEDRKRQLMRSLFELKSKEDRGNLFIKQYPTGSASILDFRIYLRDLVMRDINIDIVYVDYINLMKAAYKTDGSLYGSIKRIAEELRSLSFEFKCPFVSVSQLNREGFYTTFNEIDFNHIAESMGIPATSDFMAILGTDETQMTYESEVLYKITKSRIGGMVGTIDRFYLDRRSLKMYDASELDLWIEEATISGDERNIVNDNRD